jgi:hypothetical protein
MTISKNAEIRKLRAALQRARNYVAAAAEFEPSDDEPPSGPEVLAAIDAALVATPEAQARHRILTLLERAVEGDRWTAEDLDRLVHDLASASDPPPAPAEETASTWEKHAKSELKKARIISRRLDALLAARAPAPAVESERARIIALARKAWANGTNPWADSYRPNWHEVMAQQKPCEALVLALRPDVVLRLLGADPYDAAALATTPAPAPKRDESRPPPGWVPYQAGSCMRNTLGTRTLAEAWAIYDAEHGYAPAPAASVDEASVERLRAAVDGTLKAWDETYGPSESNEICEAMEILATARRADEEVRRGT